MPAFSAAIRAKKKELRALQTKFSLLKAAVEEQFGVIAGGDIVPDLENFHVRLDCDDLGNKNHRPKENPAKRAQARKPK